MDSNNMPDVDIAKVKRNVSKMVSMNAPESDIDQYIQSEGATVDDVRNFKSTSVAEKPKEKDSIKTQGLSFVTQHPFKTAFQGLPETLTGKTAADMANEIPIKEPLVKMQGRTAIMPTEADVSGDLNKKRAAIIGGTLADFFTSPSNLLGTKMASPVTEKAMEIGAKAVVNPIKNLMKFSKAENRVGLAEKVRNSLSDLKQATVDKYGKEYEQIIGQSEKKVNVGKVLNDFLQENQQADDLLKYSEDFGTALKKKDVNAERLRSFIDKVTEGSLPDQLSAKEADSLQKWIRNLPGIKNKLEKGRKVGFGQVDFTNSERLMLELANDIKGEVIGVHPELSSLNKEYGSVMNDLKFIRSNFAKGKTIDKLQNFSKMDDEIKAAVARRVPESILKEISSLESATRTSDLLKKVGLVAATSAGAGAAGRAGVEAYGHVIRH